MQSPVKTVPFVSLNKETWERKDYVELLLAVGNAPNRGEGRSARLHDAFQDRMLGLGDNGEWS